MMVAPRSALRALCPLALALCLSETSLAQDAPRAADEPREEGETPVDAALEDASQPPKSEPDSQPEPSEPPLGEPLGSPPPDSASPDSASSDLAPPEPGPSDSASADAAPSHGASADAPTSDSASIDPASQDTTSAGSTGAPPADGSALRPSHVDSPKRGKHRLVWPGRDLGVIDYVATGAIIGAYLAVEHLTAPRKEPRWTGGILFDDAAQKLILGKTREGRLRAQDISGYLTITPQIMAVVDGAVVPLLFDRLNWKVAWQMSVLNVQAMYLNGFLSRSGHRGIARERPDAALCRDDPDFSTRCGRGNTTSFPSGHTSTAFVGAGLVCAHHMAMPLYGHPAADIGACALGLGLASGAGILRVTTGRHYITDVIAGAIVGGGAGFLVPTFLYYRNGKKREERTTSFLVLPSVTSNSFGLGAVGVF